MDIENDMKGGRITSILYQRINDEPVSENEQKELADWIALSPYNLSVYEEVMNRQEFETNEIKGLLGHHGKAIWDKIYPRLQKPGIQPQTDKTVLILSDGTSIELDNTSNGKIAQEGDVLVIKEDDLLTYRADNKKYPAGIFYNTLITSTKENSSSLILSDGTRVWLNAASSIRFPSLFEGEERLVEITGEAYFEVAENNTKPFKVKANGMEIEVFGTHFNIKAYQNEAVKATLLEGSVKISAGGKTGFLKPGQQVNWNANGEMKVEDNVDLEQTVAWKNGILLYQKDTLEIIMQQVANLYNVEVIFEDEIEGRFAIALSKHEPISKMLDSLEKTGRVHFKIEGKKIIVSR